MQYLKNPDGSLKHSEFLQLTPDVVALTRTVDATISTSTEIVLDKATTFICVYAIAKDVYLKWGTTDVSASNFDEVILAGHKESFLVPNGYSALNVIEREAGATVIVIEK